MDTEFWFDTSIEGRIGALLGNYQDENTPPKRYALEIYSLGRIRLYTTADEASAFLFSYDIRTHLEDGKFVKISVVVDTADCLDPEGNEKMGKATLYVNGEEKDTKYASREVFASGWFSTSTPMCVGGDRRTKNGRFNEQFFKGEIKNVTVYSAVY